MFPLSSVVHDLNQVRIEKTLSILVTLVAFGVFFGPSIATAQQLNLSWIDNSGGQAGFIVQRATGTTGPFTSVGQTAPGVSSYIDSGLSFGMTYCYQVAAFDSAGNSGFSNLACGSPSGGFNLAVAKSGTGAGTVASSPSGINCGVTCSYSFKTGTAVTLAATPASGSAFTGWTSGGCSGTDPCTLAGNGSVTASATFATVGAYALAVSEKGPGIVKSSPVGISCGSVCSATYVGGALVTLIATPSKGAQFLGWSGGACSGTGTCMVTLNQATSVSATFAKGGKK